MDRMDGDSRIPPLEPFPTARRGHDERPLRLPRSAATTTWTVIGILLLVLFVTLLGAVAAYIYFGIERLPSQPTS